MIEEFQYEGEWWIPEESESKIRGTLYFSPKSGIRLELTGSFKGEEQTIFQIILGSTIDGKKITLSRCVQYFRETHTPGGETSKLKVLEIFDGEHFSKLEDINFDRISIHYSYLNGWAGFKTFKTEIKKDGETVITHKEPKAVEVKINDNLNLKLWATAGHSHSLTKYCLEDETYFIIKSSKKLTFNEYRKYSRMLQNLLTLAVGDDVSHPLKIQAYIENSKDIKKIDIYYAISGIKDSIMIPQKMLFTYSTISDRFEEFMKNWFDSYENKSLETAFNLYFGTIHNQHLYVDNQFLNYMIALESFHRSLHKSKYVTDETYEEIKDKLIQTIEKISGKLKKEGFKPSMINKLRYLHEYSLAKRLKELYKEYKDVIGDIIDNRDTFIATTKDTRNYLIHNDPESKGKACEGKDLIILNSKLKILLEMCILNVLGFSKTEIKTFFWHERYQIGFINDTSRII